MFTSQTGTYRPRPPRPYPNMDCVSKYDDLFKTNRDPEPAHTEIGHVRPLHLPRRTWSMTHGRCGRIERVSFSTRRKFIQPKFTKALQQSMALKPTVFEASNIGVNSLIAGVKIYTMIRGPEDLRLIISTPKLLHAWRGNRSLRRTRWPRA
jgi:hypothetical protein